MSSKVKCLNVNWNIIYDFGYVYHTNIGHIMHRIWDTSWNKSLRTQIGPFWLIKLPLEWFHTLHIVGQDWAALYYYCIILIIVGKLTKPDLSDLENDLLNKYINPSLDSWSISSQRSCMQTKSYQTVLSKLPKSIKITTFDLFRTFRTLKHDL